MPLTRSGERGTPQRA